MKPVLLDTGVIVALLDRSERFHQTSVEALKNLTAPLVTCEAVIAESCYLLRGLKGAAEAVVENVVSGVFQIPVPLGQSAGEVRDIMRKYRDRQIDLADAYLISLANYFGTGEILTLDRDFEVYRWGRSKPFELFISLR